MTRYRTGRHWGVTIVREDLDPAGENDQLVAVIVNGDHTLAERICQLLNADDGRDVTHWVAPDSGVTGCCQRTVFELPGTDRLTTGPANATCEGRP